VRAARAGLIDLGSVEDSAEMGWAAGWAVG